MNDYVPYKKWLHLHDDDIKNEFQDRPTEELAQEIDVSYYTVSRRAARLGVSKSEGFMHTSFKKGSRKGRKHAKSNVESDSYLREHFADTRNEELAERFGVDVKTIRRWARRLGLVKSEAFMQEVRSKGRAHKPFYTPEQTAYRNRRIAEVYPDGDEEALQRLSEELGVCRLRLAKLASDIGVKRNQRPLQYIDELAEYFPTHTDLECAERFGITPPQVQWCARKNGWKKAATHLQKVYGDNIVRARSGLARKRR